MRLSLSTEVVVYEPGVGNIKWWGSKGRDAISRNMFVHTFCFFFTQTTCHIRHWRRLLLLYNYKYKSSLPINQATSSKSHNFGNRAHDLNFHILLYQQRYFFFFKYWSIPLPTSQDMLYEIHCKVQNMTALWIFCAMNTKWRLGEFNSCQASL